MDLPRRVDWRSAGLFVGLVAASRLLLLFVLGRLVHGQEFTDDVHMLMEMARAPFALLAGLTGENGQHPPFLGVLEALLAWPLQVFFSDFYALRLTLIAYESLTALFFWLTLQVMVGDSRVRRRLEAAFLILPMGWMTSVVMSQDEVIAACFVSAVLWLVATGRERTALLVCGFGVVAAKIFLAVPLLALIVLLPKGRLWSRALLGFAPVVAVYGWVGLAAALRGNGAPLANFAPNAGFGCNIWVWLTEQYHLGAELERRWSSVAALIGGCAPLVLYRLVRGSWAGPRALAVLMTAMILWVYALFYHINPEYYVILMPALLVSAGRWLELSLAAALLSVPWAVNFFYGVARAMEAGTAGGKGVFVGIYRSVFPIEPWVMFQISLWLTIVMTIGVATAATVAILRADSSSPASNSNTEG